MEYPYLSRVTGDQIRTPDVARQTFAQPALVLSALLPSLCPTVVAGIIVLGLRNVAMDGLEVLRLCVCVWESSFGVKEPEWKGTQISDPSRLVRTADKSPDMSPEKTKLPAKAAVVEVAHL